MPLSQWYVSIDHLSDDQLEFFGWYLVRENEEFAVYGKGGYGDNEQVVAKSKKFLLVEDHNDAQQMGDYLIKAPPKRNSN